MVYADVNAESGCLRWKICKVAIPDSNHNLSLVLSSPREPEQPQKFVMLGRAVVGCAHPVSANRAPREAQSK